MIPAHDSGVHAARGEFISPDGANVVLLLGAPRSGTSWIAKIFDSHPDVLYRREPDTVLRGDPIPFLCAREDIAAWRDQARAYLERLADVRTLKSAGSLPMFRKHYRGALSYAVRAGWIYALLGADTLARGAKGLRNAAIPDFITRRIGKPPVVVVKSVSARGRARLFAEAWPKSKIVFILRHPCGQVSSAVRGVSTGKFETTSSVKWLLRLPLAKKFGLTEEAVARQSPLEQNAWEWVLLNQKAVNDLAELGPGRVKLLHYDNTCADPVTAAQELFAFAGLSWDPQSADFVRRSTTAGDTDSYYRTTRDSLAAAGKWQTTLSHEDQQRILDIAAKTPIGRLFIEPSTKAVLDLSETYVG